MGYILAQAAHPYPILDLVLTELDRHLSVYAGMTDEQVADFVSRYIPAYSAYLPGLYAQGPTTAAAGRTLVIEVDESRSPVTKQPPPLAL